MHNGGVNLRLILSHHVAYIYRVRLHYRHIHSEGGGGVPETGILRYDTRPPSLPYLQRHTSLQSDTVKLPPKIAAMYS